MKNLLCAQCGDEYVHPVAVMVEPVEGKKSVYINSDGLHVGISNKAGTTQRGISITTTFLCEEGHQWDEVRTFYKGFTLHEDQNFTTYSGRECALAPTTIWRD
jgi:hypothetical protein